MSDDITTPRPWHVGPYYRCDIHSPHGGSRPIVRGSSISPVDVANAALIVRCVNSHDDLVSVVTDYLAYRDGANLCVDDIAQRMRSALAKAL